MPDLYKTGGEYVHEESADELIGRDNDGSVFFGIMIVSGFEGYPALGKIDNAMIGDGHAVGVATNVLEKLFGTAERFLAVDDPFLASSFSEEAVECIRIIKMGKGVGERELTLPEGILHGLAKEFSNPHGKSLYRYEEIEP